MQEQKDSSLSNIMNNMIRPGKIECTKHGVVDVKIINMNGEDLKPSCPECSAEKKEAEEKIEKERREAREKIYRERRIESNLV